MPLKYELPKLPYAYDALEPYIDAKTMEIHHAKHHQAYIDKLNIVIAKHQILQEKKLEDIMEELNSLKIDETDKKMLRNHGGGHLNHTFFWNIMGPKKDIDEDLVKNITKTFGSIEEFKKQFSLTALNHFGSGWAYLACDQKDTLLIYSLPNQDSPRLLGHKPLIGLDVWEHAYYLKYQNKRAEYIENWWSALAII